MSGAGKRGAAFDQRIRDGYAVNERVADIAKALGVTRNVVIGRARRIGLSDPLRLAAYLSSPANLDGLSEGRARWQASPEGVAFLQRHVLNLHAGRDRYHAERRAKREAA